ncbi:hypothetical protein [Streptomyces halobius]|uniref:Peptidase inhibitor family I36 n=1 Tax=Streptomyces halobius TaxID=2879846 RepID=A0ABY4MFV5_9ACTN|nr:hypothetical protein [Streptomyces halobius]UQA96665.1 hypothetical protein K9S39_36600 [Streptomyces halobius]
MRSRITALLTAGLLLLFGALMTAGPASAGQEATTAGFTAQARAAGLSASQADALQEKVKRYLDTMGGKQVAPDRIQLDGGMVYLTVPGEKNPRDLAAEAGAAPYYNPCAGGGADYKHMCAYRSTNFSGDTVDMYTCKRYYFSTWGGRGSWDNNQTTGTVARMYNPSGSLIYRTPPAHSWDANGSWDPVRSIVNC